jgi:hypothetical protein
MPEEPQEEQALAPSRRARMPGVNPSLLAGDDYAYEPKPLPGKGEPALGQNPQSGGMSDQFQIVSSPLNKNY